jgi:phosphatidate cytidylyltransferase
MFVQRIIVAIFLIPIGLWLVYIGGWPFVFIITLFVGLASWEYAKLFRTGGFQPASLVTVAGAVGLVVARYLDGFDSAPWITALLILVSMAYHVVMFERGRNQAATDFAITLSGALYLGWLGAYMISLRQLPNGIWWFLLALPAVWFADSGAYFIGRRFGRRPLSPRLSPKKTWEGYFGGILVGVLGGALFAALWGIRVGTDVMTPWHGALMGLIMSVVTPLGDLGESMVKRQVGVKDSSKLIPGHGGAFDRIDSWLWASVIGYYLIVWFFI